MSSDSEIRKDLAEGATKGFLNFTKEQILEYASKIKNKELGFIGRKSTVELVKQLKKSGEWDILGRLVKRKDLRILIQTGLTLRKLEHDKDAVHELKEDITRKYGHRGIHIAQFVQSGFLGKYLGFLLPKVFSPEDLRESIESILIDIDKYVIFINAYDDIEKKSSEIKTRIQANLPKTFIITGYGKIISRTKKIKNKVESEIEGYSCNEIREKNRYIALFQIIYKAYEAELSCLPDREK